MNKLMLSAISLLVAQLALAPAATAGTQQDKMTACNKEAGEKKLAGDERKAFMKECLSAKKDGGSAAKADDKAAKADDKTAKAEDKTAKPTQQEKMTSCNKQAGEKKLTGDERKKFMSDCLKG